MKLSIIGTGYVGLITGVCLASKGHTVNCYDIDIDIVNSINNGIPHIYELKLKKILKSVLHKNKFSAQLISDINLPRKLGECYGSSDMGIYLMPLNDGEIKTGGIIKL